MEVTICILTFRRPAMLKRLLVKLGQQQTEGVYTFQVLVVDNDAEESARSTCERLAATLPYPLRYDVETVQNIARARNRCFDLVATEYAAFIDDDELPNDDWMLRLCECMRSSEADGVLGPVQPEFEVPPPDWLLKSRVLHRPVHPTGLVLKPHQTRTGNVLFHRRVYGEKSNRFDESFKYQGEDSNFFKRLIAAGYTFVWCEEARAYETEPPERCNLRYVVRRALLRGGLTWRDANRPLRLFVKSAVAASAYLFLLPLLLLFGLGLFVRYVVKLCDHVGCLLAAVGCSPEKYMKRA